MKVYVILGRFGDVYMVCKSIPNNGIIFVSSEFKSIISDLFPQFKIFEINKKKSGILEAIELAKIRFPKAQIIPCQQNGMPLEVQREFRNYQSYQEFQAREF